jgi:phospholipase C-like protein
MQSHRGSCPTAKSVIANFPNSPISPVLRALQAERNDPEMEVLLRNIDPYSLRVAVKDNSYKNSTTSKTLAAGHEGSIRLPLDKSYGWYDFSVQVEGSTAEARFPGRIEPAVPTSPIHLMGGSASCERRRVRPNASLKIT